MIKRFLWLVLLSAVAGIYTATATPAPRTACYAGTRGGGWPLIVNPTNDVRSERYPVDSLMCRRLARHAYVTLNVTPFAADPRVPLLLRHYNPGIVILSYDVLGMAFAHDPATFWGRKYAAIEKAQGWLYGTDGAKWEAGYDVDLVRGGGPALSVLWRPVVGSRLFDGAFLDYASSDISWTDGDGGRRLDYRRAGYASLAALDSARRVGVAGFVGSLSQAGGPCWLTVGNGTTPRAWQVGWAGRLYEGWPYFWGGAERAITTYAGDLRPWNIVKTESYAAPYSQEWNRAARFGLACATLGEGYACIGPDRALTAPWYGSLWQDEAAVTPLVPGVSDGRHDTTGTQVGWLGESVGPAVKLASGGWQRLYPHGAVLVNPTDSLVTFDLGVQYHRLYGLHDGVTNNGIGGTRFTVPPMDGLFLLSYPRAVRAR